MMILEQLETGEIVVTRSFDAPREKVWRAYTEPELVRQWWGPKGFTAPVIESELKTWGRYLYCMRSPEGEDYWSVGVFMEYQPPERIVTRDSFADREGNIVPAAFYGVSGSWPLEVKVEVTFEEEGNGTRLTIRHEFPPDADIDCAIDGLNETFDKLEELLKGIGNE